MEVVAA
jgi:hypothetical protein